MLLWIIWKLFGCKARSVDGRPCRFTKRDHKVYPHLVHMTKDFKHSWVDP